MNKSLSVFLPYAKRADAAVTNEQSGHDMHTNAETFRSLAQLFAGGLVGGGLVGLAPMLSRGFFGAKNPSHPVAPSPRRLPRARPLEGEDDDSLLSTTKVADWAEELAKKWPAVRDYLSTMSPFGSAAGGPTAAMIDTGHGPGRSFGAAKLHPENSWSLPLAGLSLAGGGALGYGLGRGFSNHQKTKARDEELEDAQKEFHDAMRQQKTAEACRLLDQLFDEMEKRAFDPTNLSHLTGAGLGLYGLYALLGGGLSAYRGYKDMEGSSRRQALKDVLYSRAARQTQENPASFELEPPDTDAATPEKKQRSSWRN